MKLYELTTKYSHIYDMASEDNEELVGELSKIEEQLSDKADSCVLVLRSLELESEAIKKEEERLRDRRKTIERGSERLKLYIEECMKNSGIKKIKTNLFTLSIQKNPPRLEIDEMISPDSVSEEYRKVIVQIDKEAIKQDLKKGVYLPYASLVQGESLRIK